MLTVGSAQRGWTAQDEPTRTQLLHQVARGQALLHIGGRIHLSPRADGKRLFAHSRRREGDVISDHEIMWAHMLDDVMISCIRFRRDAHACHPGQRRDVHGPIGHETDRDVLSPRGPKDQLFDRTGTCIGVDPDAYAWGMFFGFDAHVA